jgi:hypothetical protein
VRHPGSQEDPAARPVPAEVIDRITAVRNAPSPAATASMAIAEQIVTQLSPSSAG